MVRAVRQCRLRWARSSASMLLCSFLILWVTAQPGWCPFQAPPSGQPLRVPAPTKTMEPPPSPARGPRFPTFERPVVNAPNTNSGAGTSVAPSGPSGPSDDLATGQASASPKRPVGSSSGPAPISADPHTATVPSTQPTAPAPQAPPWSGPTAGVHADATPPSDTTTSARPVPLPFEKVQVSTKPMEPAKRLTPSQQKDPEEPSPTLLGRILHMLLGYLGVTLAIIWLMYLQFRRTAKPQRPPPRI